MAMPAHFGPLLEARNSTREGRFVISDWDECWCGREDSNFHGSYPTATSTLRVYQFRHDRKMFRKPPSHANRLVQANRFVSVR